MSPAASPPDDAPGSPLAGGRGSEAAAPPAARRPGAAGGPAAQGGAREAGPRGRGAQDQQAHGQGARDHGSRVHGSRDQPGQEPDGHEGLAAQGLTLSYHPAHPVVEDLSTTVEPGRVTMIVGPNACGKSTLLRALSRVITPDAGRVLLDGRDIASLRPRQLARRVGMLAQSSTAPEGITVHELVSRGRYPYQSLLRQWSAEDDDAVTQAMERTGTTSLARRRVSSLSGGQRQRAWIAMALAQRTDVLLLDEPTTYLDLAHQVEVLELCRELNEDLGTTVVAVLHDLNQACRYGDRVVAMREGRILASGAPGEVVTAELVEAVFGLRVHLLADPLTGTPLVLPLPRRAPGAARDQAR